MMAKVLGFKDVVSRLKSVRHNKGLIILPPSYTGWQRPNKIFLSTLSPREIYDNYTDFLIKWYM